jgi:uncharacterized protein (DUF983 family)
VAFLPAKPPNLDRFEAGVRDRQSRCPHAKSMRSLLGDGRVCADCGIDWDRRAK